MLNIHTRIQNGAKVTRRAMFKMLHPVSNGMRATMYTFLGRGKEFSSSHSPALELTECPI